MANKRKKRDKPGAPSKITLELIDQVSGYIRAGNYIETSFLACGVPKTVFYEWMKKGRLGLGKLYTALTDSIDRAVAEGEIRDIMMIDRAASGVKAEFLKETVTEVDRETGKMVSRERLVLDADRKPIELRPGLKPDWKANAWRAERRHPEKWGRADHVHVESVSRSSSETSNDALDKTALNDDNIRARIAKVRSEY